MAGQGIQQVVQALGGSPDTLHNAAVASGAARDPNRSWGRAAFEGLNTALSGGPTEAIVPMAAALRSGVPRTLPTHPEFARAVTNTPGASITPEGLQMSISRRQLPDQSGAESVRGGVFYLPKGDKNAKHYTGKTGYGGSDKIEGDTLYRNPLFVKGATGGKAPQAAFDQLNGKGAYEAMRTEALAAMPKWGQYRDPAPIYNFLDKHAPEMSGLAEYIMGNSKKGNTLPFALQEAAVASAARKAGHDGIIGYSTSTKTKEPFISEVYDVRENRYPSPSGDYSMWPQFEQAQK